MPKTKTTNELDHVLTYNEHTITFDAERFTFLVAGPSFPDGHYFESVQLARDAIDKKHKIRKAQEKAKDTVSLPMILHDGETRVKVHGIHMTTGRLLGIPDSIPHRNRNRGVPERVDAVYPDVPWVQAALGYQAKRQTELYWVRALLNNCLVSAGHRHHRITDVDQYNRELARLVLEVERTVKLANEHPFAKDAYPSLRDYGQEFKRS